MMVAAKRIALRERKGAGELGWSDRAEQVHYPNTHTNTARNTVWPRTRAAIFVWCILHPSKRFAGYEDLLRQH
jgi:hypothetical protein